MIKNFLLKIMSIAITKYTIDKNLFWGYIYYILCQNCIID